MEFKVSEIQNIPHSPGIYYFYDHDKLLYIGKSVNLRNRIRHHQIMNYWLIQHIEFITWHNIQSLLNNYNMFYRAWITIVDAQKIQLVFDKITRIEIKLIPKDDLEIFEITEIKKLKPLCNNGYAPDYINKIFQKIHETRLTELKNTI